VEEVFWSHVRRGPAESCWEWQGRIYGDGYGRFLGYLATHRLAYYFTTGVDPEELLVCHHCDNPPCCNPDHLFLGTHADNMRDMVQKGRHRSQTKKQIA
jgi:hypothetical protein